MDPWHEKQWKERLRCVFPQILNADCSWLAPAAGWDGFPWAVAVGLVLALHTSSMCSGVRPTQPCRDSCSHGDICSRRRPSVPSSLGQPANEHLTGWYWTICYIPFWKHFTKDLIHARCFDNNSDEQTCRNRERKWKCLNITSALTAQSSTIQ